jgi:hypothetical protein
VGEFGFGGVLGTILVVWAITEHIAVATLMGEGHMIAGSATHGLRTNHSDPDKYFTTPLFARW